MIPTEWPFLQSSKKSMVSHCTLYDLWTSLKNAGHKNYIKQQWRTNLINARHQWFSVRVMQDPFTGALQYYDCSYTHASQAKARDFSWNLQYQKLSDPL